MINGVKLRFNLNWGQDIWPNLQFNSEIKLTSRYCWFQTWFLELIQINKKMFRVTPGGRVGNGRSPESGRLISIEVENSKILKWISKKTSCGPFDCPVQKNVQFSWFPPSFANGRVWVFWTKGQVKQHFAYMNLLSDKLIFEN